MTAYGEHVLVRPRVMACRTRQISQLPRTWVRLKVLYCGVCGSDLSKFEGRRPLAYPVSLGHEFIGVIETIGADAPRPLEVGDIATSDLNFRCGRCPACQRGQSHLCERGQDGQFSNRAFADRIDLSASYLHVIHAPAAPHYALAEPLSCVLHALDWMAPRRSDRVLIVGAGGLGLCAGFAFAAEPYRVPFDIVDPIRTRARLVETAASGYGTVREVDESSGYDAVLDVSGSLDGLRSACRAVRAGGTLCTMSHLDGYGSTAFLLPALTRRDVRFKLSYLNGEPNNLGRAVAMLTTAWSPLWDATISSRPLSSLPATLETDRQAPRCKTIIKIA